MADKNDNWIKLLEVLRNFVDEEDIEGATRESRLQEDFYLSGDDALEFLQQYAKVFEVNINEFPFSEYFMGEGSFILQGIKNLLVGKKLKNLTLGKLESGIEDKRLT